MDLKQEIRELVLANQLDYMKIASVESLQDEPEWVKPADFLPGAQSVISVGMKLSLGVQLANKLAHRGAPRHVIYSYLWHGFGLPSIHFIDRTSLQVVRLLEKEGYVAVPTMSASTFDTRGSISEFSNIHAAVAAGMGEIGWSGLALTPDVGPRARYGTIITNARLEADPVYAGSRLCDLEKCRELGKGQPLCAAVCPTQAIGSETEVVKIGKRCFEVAKFDRFRCMWGSMGLSKNCLGLKDIPMPDKIGYAEINEALKQREPSQAQELIVISRGDYCGQCIMECPIGSSEAVNTLLKNERCPVSI